MSAISKVTSIATILTLLGTAILRVADIEAWQPVFVVALALLGVRIAVMVWSVRRRELAWSRLLLPSIVLVEGVGFAWSGAEGLWQLRLGTALALEVAFIAIAIRELYRSAAGSEPIEVRLARALEALVPPRVARLAALEFVIVGSAMRFLFGGWRRATPAGFTYHRESRLRLLLMMLPLMLFADVLLLELVLLPHAALWVRIVVHAAAIYGLIWLVGLYASARARPHRIADGRLVLHRALLRRLDVPVSAIASIEPLPDFADDWKRRAYLRGALRLDLAGPAILELRLREGERVLVAVDEPAPFIAALR
jgi:hypothetical protein